MNDKNKIKIIKYENKQKNVKNKKIENKIKVQIRIKNMNFRV